MSRIQSINRPSGSATPLYSARPRAQKLRTSRRRKSRSHSYRLGGLRCFSLVSHRAALAKPGIQ